jgi:hypothetical protein
MAEPARARVLLRRARNVFDDPGCPLASVAPGAWRGLFASGGRWMQLALSHLRGQQLPALASRLNNLGTTKYALASGAALLVAVPAVLLNAPVLLVLSVVAFYATEAQMVFLFPLVLDGAREPFIEARRWTIRAGGTLAVMSVVLPLAAVMLLGGFARQGFVRSWCLGCLAICIWYEDLRAATVPPSQRLRGEVP